MVNSDLGWGIVAYPVIQAIGRQDFEDVLRTGALWRWPVRTLGEVHPRGAAVQAKVPSPSSGGFCLREGLKSYPAMFRAILGINLLLWL